jgi:hypothetical protein
MIDPVKCEISGSTRADEMLTWISLGFRSRIVRQCKERGNKMAKRVLISDNGVLGITAAAHGADVVSNYVQDRFTDATCSWNHGSI